MEWTLREVAGVLMFLGGPIAIGLLPSLDRWLARRRERKSRPVGLKMGGNIGVLCAACMAAPGIFVAPEDRYLMPNDPPETCDNCGASTREEAR